MITINNSLGQVNNILQGGTFVCVVYRTTRGFYCELFRYNEPCGIYFRKEDDLDGEKSPWLSDIVCEYLERQDSMIEQL